MRNPYSLYTDAVQAQEPPRHRMKGILTWIMISEGIVNRRSQRPIFNRGKPFKFEYGFCDFKRLVVLVPLDKSI
jgi:hypothetical protein